MATRYLLPCACGQSVPVELVQAGGETTCACGATLDVPTMRALRELEPIDAAEVTRRAWGPRQGLMLLGVMAILAGGLPALWLKSFAPALPESPFARDLPTMLEALDTMPPALTLRFWQEEVLGRGLPLYPTYERVAYERTLVERDRWAWVGVAVATLGLLVLVAGLMWPRRETD